MIIIIKIIVFVLVTILSAFYSRKSLRNRQLHGFYRFFAWEMIIVLILLNIDFWFINPFSIYQIILWALLSCSLFLAIYGIYDLYRKGKPDGIRNDNGLLGLEKTSLLVTSGAYKYIRHPMYSSLLGLTWGACFKSLSWYGLILSVTACLFLVLTAKIEEKENINFFGKKYRDYMKQTKMFIPYIY